MPVIFREQINKNAVAAVWHSTESSLFAHLPRRKAHTRAAQVLLDELTSPGTHLQISYDEFGKPSLPGLHISFSHSGEYAAVMISSGRPAGIDIERIRPGIAGIAPKFMTEGEIRAAGSEEALHVYWGAKEAMYKYYGKKQLVFKEHLLLNPFRYGGSGKLEGEIRAPQLQKKISLRYQKLGDYMLVFTAE